jgi:hypothetical protein
VTLLVHPLGEVQAHPGLLPATTLDVPSADLTAPPSTTRIAFRAGPLLAADAQAPLMPTPTASGSSWSWLEQDGPVPIPAVDDRARFSGRAATAREGFVQVDQTGDAS